MNRDDIALKKDEVIKMDAIKRSLPLEALDAIQFKPCPCKAFLNPMGTCYAPDPSVGEGYYWCYDRPGMFTVATMNFRMKEDTSMRYLQPDFISLNYYDTIEAEDLSCNRKLVANCFRGHVAKGDVFHATCPKNTPIRGSELMLMPGFYEEYLEKRYPGEFQDPKAAFQSIDGCTDFPELVFLLKQIIKYKGSGVSAHLYYESKVTEALSLIIDRSKEEARSLSLNPDFENIDLVKSYIEAHLSEEIKTEALTHVACMGQTKLRADFKKAVGCTITEYIQNQRLEKAATLLVSTDETVSQVAESVGYHHAGRFSSLFKKYTGLHPDEYRKMAR